jgi:ABC-type multidrug transport system ATPase subunit
MRVTQLDFTENISAPHGLHPISMTRLNNVVVIAGKNGAGKTRLFNLLKTKFSQYPTKVQEGQLYEELRNNESATSDYIDRVKNAKKQVDALQASIKNEPLVNKLKVQIVREENTVLGLQKHISQLKERVSELPLISFSPEKIEHSIIDFVPKNLHLRDSYDLSDRSLDEYADKIFKESFSSISESALPAIQKVLKRYINVQNTQDLQITSEEREKIEGDYYRLKEYINIFLGTNLGRNVDGQATLFGKRIGEAQLSDGQKILLQFCLAIYAKETSLDNLIIFMDEPENHLHPGALVHVLDTISKHIPNGQLWIATHSVNILAHFDPSSIWYIDQGKVSFAGNIPQTVLKTLLGTEDEIEKLSSFLSLPAQMAATNFAYESLFVPNVLTTGLKDPQTTQINKIIDELSSTGKKLKVLDFGMGKGRLLATLAENERLAGHDASTWLDMYGFDVDATYRDECLKSFELVYGSSDKRYFNESKNLLAEHDQNSFDLIIMTNVLHEIDPKEWVNLFNSTHSVFQLLKKDGYLLVVEDQLLAVGEKAHSKGFLVLDTLEFKSLFNMTSVDNYQSRDERGDGRLKAHFIPFECINRINSTTRRNAVESLLATAKSEIRKIRLLPPSFKNGKLHAFWAQQLANASLTLEEI